MKKITLISIVAVILLACTKDPASSDAGSITVTANIGPLTKVATTGAASNFEEGDAIAVYAWTGCAGEIPATRVVDGVVNTLGSDGKWIPASPMCWTPGTHAHYFLGVSPVHAISDFTADAYALSGDSAVDDLLLARNLDGLKPGSGAVALAFSHAMARLTVNVKVRTEFGASPAVSVSVSAKSGATVNCLTGAVTPTGTASAVSLPAAASAPSGYTHSFSGIQVPQGGVKTITLTVAGKEFVYEAGEDIPLQSGHHTTLGLLVGKNKIELSGVTVAEWTAGASLPGGKALVQHDYVDMGNGLKWATCNVGADNPWDYGDYFDWGATVPYYQTGYSQESPCTHWIDGKSGYNWANYSFMEAGQSSWNRITKYTFADGQTNGTWWYDGDTFVGDGKTSFADYDYADDAARANWGAGWRTPTDAEWTWLLENCTWTWTTNYNGSGVNGMLVTSTVNGKQIFLPAAGYRGNDYHNYTGDRGFYWSSSLNVVGSDFACELFFRWDGFDMGGEHRDYGQSVRPVTE